MNRQEMIKWAEENEFRVATFESGHRGKEGFVIEAKLDGVVQRVLQAEPDPESWLKYWRRTRIFDNVLMRWRGIGMIVVSGFEGGPGYGLCKDF
ncbi:MAG: hypothetical protein UX99_C0037G0002 [Candidatus Amesbacteria bacterium GW2011_GWB1_47_26]|uniref:Uncharacterized protein n=1 Tax=Candidatus Amesbacteria bacterium GW2011_GWC2_45_19 TaxID=1618366 RepID=A0A0G1PBJ4_9BACT|nr:MAG: hypothetical protein UX05_C0007G0007 [Candidatus Amesbacteria bacterium GW2011_GWC2_45_19]KKU68358.1 MAG: hypothetical protein UX93_C0008G0007 [Microgenomates group bacterium GW2011_GWC1_47_20]KKU72937.1 MAG: hypothetical protein UX99_C0037G0002 [Candidatus Amesbacteria bacterium GW2011_GWB1_47_26]